MFVVTAQITTDWMMRILSYVGVVDSNILSLVSNVYDQLIRKFAPVMSGVFEISGPYLETPCNFYIVIPACV